jgi:tyrosyl-tRNA synthetase
VHGAEALQAAEEVSQLLFGKGDPKALSGSALELLGREIPLFAWPGGPSRDTSALIEVISTGKDALFKSKGEARRALDQGGLYVNGERLSKESRTFSSDELLHGRYVLVRKGARSYGLVQIGAEQNSKSEKSD